ncbi:MAG: exosortase C-terminal domain/associated protein EpsI [Pyrinomonadaceae bacterium]
MAKNNKTDVYYWIMLALLVFGGLGINWLDLRGEAIVTRVPLAELPKTLGGWNQYGKEIRFSPETESVLKATEYIDRYYYKDGRFVDVYVGYYASQKSGQTYHSPQNCLPGAGWEMREPQKIEITMPNGGTFSANKYIIENGKFREVMIYWYQGRGRRTASEYDDKVYTIFDSITRSRSDGALVRVMTSIGNSEDAATDAATNISGMVSEELNKYIPE